MSIRSALNNLDKRIQRHKSNQKKMHWHIDYLLKKAKIIDVKTYPEIADFFRRCKMNRFWTEDIADQETFYIAFPEFILSKDYNKI